MDLIKYSLQVTKYSTAKKTKWWKVCKSKLDWIKVIIPHLRIADMNQEWFDNLQNDKTHDKFRSKSNLKL